MTQSDLAQLKQRTAAIILAAGQSRRMAGSNKLLADLQGRPILAHTLRSVSMFDLGQTVVVTGFDSGSVERLATEYEFPTVHNTAYPEGMGTSIAAGVAALPEGIDAALICLGDMPFVSRAIANKIFAAFATVPDRTKHIALPKLKGRRGHPVLFGSSFFHDLLMLTGDRGARDVISSNEGQVLEIDVDDDGIHRDIDTPSDLEIASTSSSLTCK